MVSAEAQGPQLQAGLNESPYEKAGKFGWNRGGRIFQRGASMKVPTKKQGNDGTP